MVREDVYKNNRKINDLYLTLESSLKKQNHDAFFRAFGHIAQTPVFTFVTQERVGNSPWYTGTHDLHKALCRYIEREGGEVKELSSVWVPFSNGSERGLHGFDSQVDELRYVTSDRQFVDTFGVSAQQLWNNWMAGEV